MGLSGPRVVPSSAFVEIPLALGRDLENLEPLRIESVIQKTTLSTTIHVTTHDAVVRAERLLPTLHDALAQQGFAVKSATCV